MTIRRFVVPVVVDEEGAATAYSPVLSGKLVSIRYVKTDFEDGVDFAITSEATGATLWAEESVDASATRHPRAPTHSQAGVAAIYVSEGPGVLATIALSQDRVKIVVANGTGDDGGETGTFHITVDG